MNHGSRLIRHCLTLLTFAASLWLAPTAAQAQTQSQPMTSPNSDVTRQELANFDRFLDSHPELAEQIRANPSLVNNDEFVENHSDLANFLQSHPGVREEITENPNAFMHKEQRFDRREDQDRDQDRDRDRDRDQDRNFQRNDSDVTHRELRNMDAFLDSHPEIAEQLRKNPALVDDKDFVSHHPELKEFLANHPGVREEFRENPNGFMRQEEGFDRREDNRFDRDVTHRELRNMDQFLDQHPEIAEQLQKNPSLVDDKKFVSHHPELQEFLASHPGVREEIRENPNAFMREEEGFDANHRGMRGDRDVTRRELSSFGEFLEDHNKISEELTKNPTLAKNEEFLENHPALRDYLQSHPRVQEELNENPQQFVKSAQQFSTTKPPSSKVLTEPKSK